MESSWSTYRKGFTTYAVVLRRIASNGNSGHPADVGNNFEVDPDGLFSIDDNDYQVTVPEINIQLSNTQRAYLCSHCYPLRDYGDSGKNLFINCKEILLNFHL